VHNPRVDAPGQRWRGFRDGAVSVLPVLLGVVPFGLVFGVAAASTKLPPFEGWSTSWIIFAGAAQLAVVRLLEAGAPAAVVIATAWIINARFLMYGASLAPHLAHAPLGWRLLAPYLLTDQAYLMSILRFRDEPPFGYRLSFYLGAATLLWFVWQTKTGVGELLGAGIPASWSLEFAIPLTFLALLVPAARGRAALVAALVGGAVAVAALPLPYNLGLIVGALCGVASGAWVEWRMTR